MVFLPLLQDSGKGGREGLLAILASTVEKYKRRAYGWVWAEAMAQTKLEDAFDILDRDKPAVVALNAKKLKYTNMVGSFSVDGISTFVNRVVAGKGGLKKLAHGRLPEITETATWDGGDYIPGTVEEEFDLSELMDDDDDDGGGIQRPIDAGCHTT